MSAILSFAWVDYVAAYRDTKTLNAVDGQKNRTKNKHANASDSHDMNVVGLPRLPKYKVGNGTTPPPP